MNTTAYFNEMNRRCGSYAEARLRHQMGFLYRDVDFLGKRVLDVGGGTGLHSFFALARGAAEAVVIEPEGDGGHDEMIAIFNSWRTALKAETAELVQAKFQNYCADKDRFDIVLIQDAINHFDEEACITLRKSKNSQAIYDAIFEQIAALVRTGGTLILSDCSSQNLFPTLRLVNPIDPKIEWHKHQAPSVWVSLAERHGLEKVALDWSTPTRFGKVGKVFFGNSIAAWFFTSHFVLQFKRK